MRQRVWGYVAVMTVILDEATGMGLNGSYDGNH